MSVLRVELIALTHFLGLPEGFTPLSSQDQGSEGARLIEFAGRTCYSSVGKGRDSESYHAHILESGHGSVTEHVNLTFYIAGISRACSMELLRHRAGIAVSQQSTRYVAEEEADWCWHPLIDPAGAEVNHARDICRQTYRNLVAELMGALEARGVDKVTARKQARGAARGVLGNALATALVITFNVRALRHVIEMRASEAADAEIRLLANRLYEEARKAVPEYFSDYQQAECPDGIGYALTTEHRKL